VIHFNCWASLGGVEVIDMNWAGPLGGAAAVQIPERDALTLGAPTRQTQTMERRSGARSPDHRR
jgi:hypothetical protein